MFLLGIVLEKVIFSSEYYPYTTTVGKYHLLRKGSVWTASFAGFIHLDKCLRSASDYCFLSSRDNRRRNNVYSLLFQYIRERLP